MADFVKGQGGLVPPYTPSPSFDIDLILSGKPLSDRADEDSIMAALGLPVHNGSLADVLKAARLLSVLGNYRYDDSSEASLPAEFSHGNYLCYFIGDGISGYRGYLYMAPVDTMAFKQVADIVYNGGYWNVTPIN